MAPYLVLLFVPMLFSKCRVVTSERFSLQIGRRFSMDQKNLALPLFFTLLMLMLMFRSESVGRDLSAYHYLFSTYRTQELQSVFSLRTDSLYTWICVLIGQLTDNFQWVIAVTSLVTVLPISFVYCQDRKKSCLEIAIFTNMATFVMLFSGIRQSMAIAMGMLAFYYIRNKKSKMFLLSAVAAVLSHGSGFMVFLLYPIYYMRLKKKHLWFIVPIIIIILAFNRRIFNLLSIFYTDAFEKYGMGSSTGAYSSLIMFALFTAFCYFVVDENQMDEEVCALRNILIVATAMQCFAPLHTLAMRMNYYFIIFIPLAVGKCVAIPKKQYAQIARLGEIVMTVFFAVYFCVTTYNSYVSGVSLLDTIPYIPFFAE